MARFTVTGATGKQLASRMTKLAWDAGRVIGMGVLQDRGPGMTEDDVYRNSVRAATEAEIGRVDADYMFGRMMKLYFSFGPDWVEGGDNAYRHDYQSFAGTYPDFSALTQAAAASLGVNVA